MISTKQGGAQVSSGRSTNGPGHASTGLRAFQPQLATLEVPWGPALARSVYETTSWVRFGHSRRDSRALPCGQCREARVGGTRSDPHGIVIIENEQCEPQRGSAPAQ